MNEHGATAKHRLQRKAPGEVRSSSGAFLFLRKGNRLLKGSADSRKVFATVLQTPKSFSWHLQRCCKHRKVFRGTCNSVANTKKFFEALATVLQTPKSFSRHLQRCCKRQKVFRGTCNGVANTKKFFVALATVLQTPKSFWRDLQQCCKRFQRWKQTLFKLVRALTVQGGSCPATKRNRDELHLGARPCLTICIGGEGNAPTSGASYLFSSPKRISRIWQAALATEVPGP